jgi:hypothetical protein
VRLAFAERQLESELMLSDILAAQGEARMPVLFVIVTSIDFVDRVGDDPAAARPMTRYGPARNAGGSCSASCPSGWSSRRPVPAS